MRSKDGVFLLLLALVLAALFAPVLFFPSRLLGNFGDIYAYHYPLRHLCASSLQAGRVPFWNPYIFGGVPLLANSQAGVFDPLSILFQTLPVGYAFTWHAALCLALAGAGMHLFMRACGLGGGASGAFAMAWALCPFVVCRIPQGIPTHLAALAYVPWCWLALRSGRAGLLAAVWALQLLSGHPQFALINGLGMALYVALQDRGKTAYFLREGAWVAFLGLAQWVPTAEYLRLSNRSLLPAEFSAAYSMPARALLTFLSPGFAGDPLTGDFLPPPSVFFESYCGYVGLAPLGLALWALARPGSRRPGLPSPAVCWLIAGAGALLALGSGNPLEPLLRAFPVVGLSRVPSRFALLTVWGLLLAAAGAWLALRKRGRALSGWSGALLLLVLFDAGAWSSRFLYAEDPSSKLSPAPGIVETFAGGRVRMATSPELANPNKTMLYRVMNVNGYEAYYPAEYARYVSRSEAPTPAVDPSRTYVRNVQSPLMRRLGVAYYLGGEARPELGPGRSLDGAAARLYENPGAFPMSYLQNAGEDGWRPVRWHMPSAERWWVLGRGGAGSKVVLGVPRYPGWRVWLNGRRVETELRDGLVQAVSLAGLRAGSDFRLHARFIPTGWTALCLLSCGAWLAWTLLTLVPAAVAGAAGRAEVKV